MKNMKLIREYTMTWLENQKSHGNFTGMPEEDMQFDRIDDEDIKWYFENWVVPDMTDEWSTQIRNAEDGGDDETVAYYKELMSS